VNKIRFPVFIRIRDSGRFLGGARNRRELEACEDAHPYEVLDLEEVSEEEFEQAFFVE
jgi:hypothetical protein